MAIITNAETAADSSAGVAAAPPSAKLELCLTLEDSPPGLASALTMAALPDDLRSRMGVRTTASSSADKANAHFAAELLANGSLMFNVLPRAGSSCGPAPGLGLSLHLLPNTRIGSGAATDSRVGSANTTATTGGASSCTARTTRTLASSGAASIAATTAGSADMDNRASQAGTSCAIPYRISCGSITALATGACAQGGEAPDAPLPDAEREPTSTPQLLMPPLSGVRLMPNQGVRSLITSPPTPVASAPASTPAAMVAAAAAAAAAAAIAAAAAAQNSGACASGASAITSTGHPADNLLRYTSLETFAQELKGLSFIGSGASGNVYSCQWRGMPVCVKFMLTDDVGTLQRQQREATLSRLASHPHLVQTYSVAVAQLTPAHFASAEAAGPSGGVGQYNSDLLGTCMPTDLYGTTVSLSRCPSADVRHTGTGMHAHTPHSSSIAFTSHVQSTGPNSSPGEGLKATHGSVTPPTTTAPVSPALSSRRPGQMAAMSALTGEASLHRTSSTSVLQAVSSPSHRPLAPWLTPSTAPGPTPLIRRSHTVDRGGAPGQGPHQHSGSGRHSVDVSRGTMMDGSPLYQQHTPPQPQQQLPRPPSGPKHQMQLNRTRSSLSTLPQAARTSRLLPLSGALPKVGGARSGAAQQRTGGVVVSVQPAPGQQHSGTGPAALASEPPASSGWPRDVRNSPSHGRHPPPRSPPRAAPRRGPCDWPLLSTHQQLLADASSGGAGPHHNDATINTAAISTVDIQDDLPFQGVAKKQDSFCGGLCEPSVDAQGLLQFQVSDVLTHMGARPGQWVTAVVMEEMDRGSLHHCIHHGPLRPDGTPGRIGKHHRLRAMVRVLLEVAQGMAHLHSAGLVHGDLKPANVLLKANPRDVRGFIAKVSDFGVTRAVPCGLQCTVTTNEWGTVIYTAPEVFNGRSGPASDVFSFGVLTWQLATGLVPYEEVNPFAVMLAVSRGDLALDWPSSVPKPLKKLGKLCTQHDVDARPSFGEIAAALIKLEKKLKKGASESSPSTPVAAGPLRQRRK